MMSDSPHYGTRFPSPGAAGLRGQDSCFGLSRPRATSVATSAAHSSACTSAHSRPIGELSPRHRPRLP